MLEVGERKFVFADPTKCTGCGTCELVCALEKEKKFKPSLSRIKVNRLFGILNFVSACRFCENAPCVAACPTNALTQSEDTGVILVESEKCNGCGWCIQACSYGAVTLHPEATSVLICDLCGGEPKCVEWCPEEALELVSAGEQNEMLLFTLSGKLIKGR